MKIGPVTYFTAETKDDSYAVTKWLNRHTTVATALDVAIYTAAAYVANRQFNVIQKLFFRKTAQLPEVSIETPALVNPAVSEIKKKAQTFIADIQEFDNACDIAEHAQGVISDILHDIASPYLPKDLLNKLSDIFYDELGDKAYSFANPFDYNFIYKTFNVEGGAERVKTALENYANLAKEAFAKKDAISKTLIGRTSETVDTAMVTMNAICTIFKAMNERIIEIAS